MKKLEYLQQRLERAFKENFGRLPWGQPELMTNQLNEVKKSFESSTKTPPDRSINKSLLVYRQTGTLQTFLDVKYACFGICQETDGWRLLDDDRLFPSFINRIEKLKSEPRKFKRCYQGLLSGYFSYPLYSSQNIINWEKLREYLAKNLLAAQQAHSSTSWLTILNDHNNLLGPKPFDRYVSEVRDGNFEKLRLILQQGLGVSRESWVWQAIVLSQVEVACGNNEALFKEDLERLIRMLQANTSLSVNLVIQCVALLVSRYSNCTSKPEHPALRDIAVAKIGNPWLRKTSWDAYVKTQDGNPNETARLMIKGWIKRQLIKDFFELLIDDGTADQRRLDYWLAFEPVIENMWFALGPHARQHQGREFKEFRGRAKEMLRELTSPGGSENNAFIMRIGRWYIVEFGKKGNACFIHNQENLPFKLENYQISGATSSLKNPSMGGKRFIHKDSINSGKWEEQLDYLLRPLIDFRRPQGRTILRRPNDTRNHNHQRSISAAVNMDPLLDHLENLNVPVKDLRSTGSALWIMTDNSNQLYNLSFTELGFKYKPGKGWWKE